jgi:hypothetical protein
VHNIVKEVDMIYAGLDLHKNFSVITAMDAQGKEIIKQRKVPNKAPEKVMNL